MKTLKIDENNDRPILILRHGSVDESNLFYALLAAKRTTN